MPRTLRSAGDPMPGLDPNKLLDELIDRLKLKNDAALCRLLGATPPTISKIRHHRLQVGAAILIRMHEASGISIRELRGLMGDHRKRFGISDAAGWSWHPEPGIH